MMLGQGFYGLFLQGMELVRVIEIAGLVIGKEIGSNCPGIGFERENGVGYARALVDQALPDIGGRELGMATQDVIKKVDLVLLRAERQGLGLREGDFPFVQRDFGVRAQGIQGQTPLDGRRGQPGLRGDLIELCPALDQRSQRGGLFQGREVGALQVFDRGEPQTALFGKSAADFDRDGEILGQFAALLQEFQGAIAALPADDGKAFPLALGRGNDKILQQPAERMLAASPSRATPSNSLRGLAFDGTS